MEKINIAELLKDCPTGMELDCTMYDSVTLLSVDDREDICFPIRVVREDGNSIALTKYGQYTDADFAKCVIFPKGETSWYGFQRPFKDGDILFVKSAYSWIFIYKESENKEDLYKYVGISDHPNHSYIVYDDYPLCCKKDISKIRFATEDEKEKLFKAIKDNGYKWNAETKTLEKLIVPKFKVGDRVQRNNPYNMPIRIIKSLECDRYRLDNGNFIYFGDEGYFKLLKFDISTLKPFDKVLVRSTSINRKWVAAYYSHYDKTYSLHHCVAGGLWYEQCIPYNDETKHLLGTTNDCDECYKTWK